ncbi:MAG: autotransporter outer membrane beta-barrel domain-containing protein [Mediterranea sp.]|jgi:hypothetical protein|nr:autotransporter outer membrane beta-barrel domain-containing protein [Mediterranea sp.]
MKKLLFVVCLLLTSLGAKAQFKKNSWVINPTITGLEYSYNDASKNHLGFSAHGGAFVMDNVALLLKLGSDWTNTVDTYSLGVSGRYYSNRTGLYAGGGLYANLIRNGNNQLQSHKNDLGLSTEAGYAFFLSRTVTIEPAVYYDYSFKDSSDFSKFGLKVGFGFYF